MARKNVTFSKKKSCTIDKNVKIDEGTKIEENVKLLGNTAIGKNCVIGSFSVLTDSIVGDGCEIVSSRLTNANIGKNVWIGPFAHIRPSTTIDDGAKIGNFVEIKSSYIGKKSKISHLSYVGNAVVGSNVNVGCGVIFANYDGKNKFQTIVGDNVFIGSNCNLIAPVNIGDDSFIAAGTTITKDLLPKDFAIGRVRQETKSNYLNKYAHGILEDKQAHVNRNNIFFGTDGIRGVFGKDITKKIATVCSQALCRIIHSPKIVVGKDTRKSGPELFDAIVSGLENGSQVFDLGICPTPCVAYMTQHLGADFGIAITASHNPHEHNGIKIFASDGKKLGLVCEQKIDNLMRILLSAPPAKNESVDVLKTSFEPYIQFVLSQGTNFKGMKIALDLANGAATSTAVHIFKKLGADIKSVGDDQNGLINEGVGCLHTASVSALVQDAGADIGFAFDGDADRILAVSPSGRIIDGDQMLFAIAKILKQENKLSSNLVVATLQSNIALKNSLAKLGIETILTPVGDKYVVSAMEEHGASIGGEQSGHIISREVCGSGDGVLIAVMLASFLFDSGKTADQFFDLRPFPQLQTSFICQNKDQICKNERILEQISVCEKKLDVAGRVLFRESGTEQKVRLLVEAEEEEKCRQIFDDLSALIKDEIKRETR